MLIPWHISERSLCCWRSAGSLPIYSILQSDSEAWLCTLCCWNYGCEKGESELQPAFNLIDAFIHSQALGLRTLKWDEEVSPSTGWLLLWFYFWPFWFQHKPSGHRWVCFCGIKAQGRQISEHLTDALLSFFWGRSRLDYVFFLLKPHPPVKLFIFI